MVLGGDIVQALWSAVHRCQNSFEVNNLNGSYYFSTHGCSLVLSSIEVGLLEDEAPLDAAAAARALLLKKFDILAMDGDATESESLRTVGRLRTLADAPEYSTRDLGATLST